MTKIGYARCSTAEQVTDSQADQLQAAGCEPANIYVDHGVSGKLASRPQWDACNAALAAGDQLVVVRLDRLGRSLRNLLDVADNLRDREVDLVILNMGIDTSTPGGELVFNIFAALAQFEAQLTRERTMDGLDAARARGRKGGRPPANPRRVQAVRSLHTQGATVAEIAKALDMSRATVYRHLETSKAD